MVTLETVKTYLRLDADDMSRNAAITTALAAESAAQARRCRVPDPMPADLAEALCRRVARNLALRNVPLAVLQGDGELGSTRLPGSDPEIRRLEAPWRRLAVG